LEEIFTGSFFAKKERIKKFYTELFRAIPFFSDQEGDTINLHQVRVAFLASALGAEILEANRILMFLAGLYHDLGAVGASLHPVRAFSLSDYFVDPWLANHPLRSAQILRKFDRLKPVASIVVEHHEWYDGGGFPFKKKAGEILPEAQALRITDSFDAAMLLTGRIDEALKLLEKKASREFDGDLYSIFKHFIKTNDFEFLWHQPQTALELAISQLESIKILFDDSEIFCLLKAFDVKRYPQPGHTRRVRDLVALISAEIGYVQPDALIRAATVHEVYTVYEPYKGSYLGAVDKKEVLEYFELLSEAFADLEKDPFVSELVYAVCYVDRKLSHYETGLSEEDFLDVLSYLNGRVNPEVLLAINRVLKEHSESIYKDMIKRRRLL
jgi:HD-GYP domain-containing protein (c-di-GMP phosphodiesterase class II)